MSAMMAVRPGLFISRACARVYFSPSRQWVCLMWRFALDDSMGSSRLSVLLCSLFLLSVVPLTPVTADESNSWHDPIVISEVLVSASSADYDGTDWNGDG